MKHFVEVFASQHPKSLRLPKNHVDKVVYKKAANVEEDGRKMFVKACPAFEVCVAPLATSGRREN
jgi:hypothetical protein